MVWRQVVRESDAAPVPRFGHVAAVLGDFFVVLGGRDPTHRSKHHHHSQGGEGEEVEEKAAAAAASTTSCACFDDLFVFDIPTRMWCQVEIGGDSLPLNTLAHSTLSLFPPSSSSSSSFDLAPTAAAAASGVKQTLFTMLVFGGSNGFTDTSCSNEMHLVSLDVLSGPAAALDVLDAAAAAAAADDDGGEYGDDGAAVNDVEEYFGGGDEEEGYGGDGGEEQHGGDASGGGGGSGGGEGAEGDGYYEDDQQYYDDGVGGPGEEHR